MSGRLMLLALLVALASGCQNRVGWKRFMQDDCPKPTTDPVEACDELPADYGLRRDRPVEWGLGGGQPPRSGPRR